MLHAVVSRVGRGGFSVLSALGIAWIGTGQVQGAAPSPRPSPTYAADIAPLIQRHCLACHRTGEVGPFPLETYEQVRKRAKDIAAVVEVGDMPPWKPNPGVGPKLKYTRDVSNAEAQVLRSWADAGAPQGNPVASPKASVNPDSWTLGTPDLILQAEEVYQVPASGPDIYRCFVIPTRLARDVTISAVEYRPENRRVVHHMMAFIDTSGMGRERDAADPGAGYTSFSGPGVEVAGDLGGWAAGNVQSHLPEGVGRIIPGRSDIIIQVHYHPSGKPETDRARLGIYFSKKPIRQSLQWANASNDYFQLPAGKSDIVVKATWFVPVEVEALAVTPHMHALGRDFRMSVTFPDGRTQTLLHIPDWDPNWQDTYYFQEPVTLPKRSLVTVTAHYDNSAHARNPNSPPKLVKRGPAVNDEMCVGYIGVVKKGQDLTRPAERDDLYEILSKQKFAKMRKEWDQAQRRKP